MKHIKLFENFDIINNSSDILQEGDVLFHGTSYNQYIKIKDNNFIVNNLYLTTSKSNAIEYAYITCDRKENQEFDPVLIVINYELLEGILIDDIHDYGDDDQQNQEGQYIFNGNIKKSIFHVYNLSNKKEVINYKSIKLLENFKEDIDVVGKEMWFEYHCWESPNSDDAELWYRSHQKVKVLSRGIDDYDEFPEEPKVYNIEFSDGFKGTAYDDELFDDPIEFYRPDPPKIKIKKD